jgi:hypothetical protein
MSLLKLKYCPSIHVAVAIEQSILSTHLPDVSQTTIGNPFIITSKKYQKVLVVPRLEVLLDKLES